MFWEQGNMGFYFRGTGEQRQYWVTGNIENKFSIFGEQGNKPIYFRGTREQIPPWEGLPSVHGHPFLSSGLHHGNISVQKLHVPTYSKMGVIWAGIKMIKSDFFSLNISPYIICCGCETILMHIYDL